MLGQAFPTIKENNDASETGQGWLSRLLERSSLDLRPLKCSVAPAFARCGANQASITSGCPSLLMRAVRLHRFMVIRFAVARRVYTASRVRCGANDLQSLMRLSRDRLTLVAGCPIRGRKFSTLHAKRWGNGSKCTGQGCAEGIHGLNRGKKGLYTRKCCNIPRVPEYPWPLPFPPTNYSRSTRCHSKVFLLFFLWILNRRVT